MSGAHGSPHFYGFMAALVLLVAGVVWVVRRRRAGKQGPPGVLLAAAVPLLLTLGIFGNGSTADFARGLAMNEPLPPRVTRTHLDASLRVALSAKFLRYHAALEGEPLDFRGADLQSRLSIRIVNASEARDLGIQMSPPPAADWRGVFFEYVDVENVALGWLRLGSAGRQQRFLYVQELTHRYLADLLALELYRTASTEQERLDALEPLGRFVPEAAEWIARDLRRFRADATPPVRAAIDQKLAHVQQYIDDPTMRALPAGRRVTLH